MPREFVLVYAPRTEGEVRVVMEIVGAAVWWVSGVHVRREGEGESQKRVEIEDERFREGNECWSCTTDGCGSGGARLETMVDDA